MLSDAIKHLRGQQLDGVDAWLLLTLRVFELEARYMEALIHDLTGRPHVALDGRLMAVPGEEARHV